MPLLGAHQSIAGGRHLAFARIAQVGGESLQIFTANQRQWRVSAPGEEEIARFREAWREHGKMPVAAHASYLINLAALEPEAAAKSAAALVDELHRCRLLGIRLLVIHPGSHGGAGVEAGLARVVHQLDLALEQAEVLDVDFRILLETTAGQGTSLGSRFAELGWLLGRSRYPGHLGVCIDTCHMFAAGYDLRGEEGYGRTLAELEQEVGLDRVRFVHLNDSKKGCGSRVDRHAHIGQGEIGDEGFRLLLNDPRFSHLPMVLETPKGEDLADDGENLRRLRSLMIVGS
jgi:deoxyribonuclease-4